MGERFWSWYLANKVRAHVASFLIGMLIVLIPGLMIAWFWSWYLRDKDNVVPLLAPLASLLTGLLTVIVASFVAWTALQQAEIARLRHEEQTRADLQRRITESFTKAVDQLGSDKLQVRLGGIYTLERIARESELDYWPIMETLTAFVRERARWKGEDTVLSETVGRLYQDEAPQRSDHRLPADVAAVLTVIRRRDDRNHEREQSNQWRLDLTSTDLRRADLAGAHLEEAYLIGVHLEKANLGEAHLEKAHLSSAYLERAIFFRAHLEEADFIQAHLEEADFFQAHLERTLLFRAHLEGAVFSHAHLEGADLHGATGLTQDQLDQAFGDAETKLPEGLTRPAHWLQ